MSGHLARANRGGGEPRGGPKEGACVAVGIRWGVLVAEQGLGFWGLWFRVGGLEFRVWDLEFRVCYLGCGD